MTEIQFIIVLVITIQLIMFVFLGLIEDDWKVAIQASIFTQIVVFSVLAFVEYIVYPLYQILVTK